MNPRKAADIIREYLKTPEGRRRLAQSMPPSLDKRLGYVALWRRLLERDDKPFCEPLTLTINFETDPKGPRDAILRDQELALSHFRATVGDKLITLLRPPSRTYDYREIEGPNTYGELLEDHREFCKQPGFILLNARTYAGFRKHCRDILDVEERPELLNNALPVHEAMRFWITRLVEPWVVLFVPTTDLGRYADTLEVEALPEPITDSRLPAFGVTLKVCLDVDPSNVREVELTHKEGPLA